MATSEDPLYARTIQLFSELLVVNPTQITGYDQFGIYACLGVDMMNGDIVQGAATYDELDDLLASQFGNEYSLRFMIVERTVDT